ncbi:TetR/AcrR family transcriptional regulator [Jatrophihabitans sp. DSM 45814]
MSEHTRSSNVRDYRMSKRADDIAETRRRIVKAAVRLHGSIGPAATTISALAEEAGVTRLTVYRHFPDDESLFAACSAHWGADQVMPDPAAWGRIADPLERLRTALADLYRFYRSAEPMLTNVNRDRAALPTAIRKRNEATDVRYRDLLLQPFTVRGRARARLRAVLGHAVAFSTWRSLCVDQRLSDRDAAQAMTAMARATADPE